MNFLERGLFGGGTTTTNHTNSSSSSSMTLTSTGLTSGGQVLTVGSGNSGGDGDPLLPPPAVPLLMAPLSSNAGGSSGAPAFRCGVCNQVSNWKHVIQRHCRLKHNGNIQVIENRMMDEDGPELSREGGDEPIPSGSSHLLAALSLIDTKPSSKKSFQGKTSPAAPPSGDEDSMGYMMHPDKQQYSCSTCPFICKSLTDIEVHRQHHKPGPGRPIKCTLCPFFVSDKQELAQHLLIHGLHDMKLDASGNLCSFGESKLPSVDDGIENSSNTAAGGSNTKRFHHCGLCPYVCESKSQYVYHRQFHRTRGAPYKCPQCSFNVTRRHLLNQHLAVHQQSAGNTLMSSMEDVDQFGAAGSEEEAEAAAADGTEDSATSSAETEGSLPGAATDGYVHLNLDPTKMSKLEDSVTTDLADIPLTWVSRGRKFYKMFKCRHCPHVNVRKANIQEHEKRHNLGVTGSGGGTGENLHACALCNYRCNNAGVLSAHVKVHQSVLGIIHGLAGQDPTKTDDEQLRALIQHPSEPDHQIADESCSSLSSSGSLKNQPKLDVLLGRVSDDPELMLASEPNDEGNVGGGLHFCAHCPARFLVEAELLIHQRFHGLVKLAFRCNFCSYTARQEAHLLAHWKVHSSEYQERTRILTEQHGVSSQHPKPFIKAVHQSEEDEVEAIDLTRKELPPNNDGLSLCCPLCPAKFGRESSALLQYHSTLHGSDWPFKCRHCNYAVKAPDNLTKHEKLHQQQQAASSSNESKQNQQQTNNTTKRYQCPKCPSGFEKKEQFKIHSNLHGSKQRYRCDRCDYAVKYYANYLQHVKKHEDQDSLSNNQSIAVHTEVAQSTAERQHLWLQEKLQRSPQDGELFLSCQFCPFKTNSQPVLSSHTAAHACQGATGSVRCNFCDFTAAEQSHLVDHIQLHFQLKGRIKSKLPESYWKCSNLEIWSEPVNKDSTSQTAALVFTENNRAKTDLEDEDEEGALYIDLNTSQPLKDDPKQVEI